MPVRALKQILDFHILGNSVPLNHPNARQGFETRAFATASSMAPALNHPNARQGFETQLRQVRPDRTTQL